MKTITKLAAAALFALSAAAPAFATDPEALQFEERNTFINSTGPLAQHVRAPATFRAHRATDAMARAHTPVRTSDVYVKEQSSMDAQ